MENKTKNAPDKIDLDNTTTYHIQNQTFIVEPVFKQESTETIASILLKLMIEATS